MKLFIIQTRYTKVPYGLLFGGLDGWFGIRGLLKFITEKKSLYLSYQLMFFNRSSWHGLIMVNTEINWEKLTNLAVIILEWQKLLLMKNHSC